MKHFEYQDYRLFRRSPALLWLKNYRPLEYQGLPSGRHNYSSGKRFEELAVEAFYSESRTDLKVTSDSNLTSEVARRSVLNDGELSIQPDILIFDDNGACEVVEITSATSVKKSVLEKLTLTGRVLSNLGIEVSGYSVLFIDRFVPLQGEFDARVMTRHQDVSTKVVELFDFVARTLSAMQMLDPEVEDESLHPAFVAGGFRSWLDAYRQLNQETIEQDDPLMLPALNQQQLRRMRSEHVDSLYELDGKQSWLSKTQKIHLDALHSDGKHVDRKKLQGFIDSLEYPLYFLDYETAGSSVPPFQGMTAHQQLPFQYSLYKIESPGAKPQRHDYLHQENTNPSQQLSEQLLSEIGDKGSVLVWFKDFEKSCNVALARAVPEHRDRLLAINERLVDLMVPFKNKWYYDIGFHGSSSLKSVLPVLAPELAYDDLTVRNGADAQRLWMEVFIDGNEVEDLDKFKKELLAYCDRDTYGMVAILDKIQNIDGQERLL